MLPFVLLLSLVPVAGYFISRRCSEEKTSWLRTAGYMLALYGAGLLAASPFLTDRAVGTGEAYNYSLAVADAVTQLRAGEIPVLAGQTEFAFNGRVHPLRNAPYLVYLAGAFDLVTSHRLTFWELQNLSLAFSLVAAGFAAYASLRWGSGCTRPTAFLLALSYGWCPALLAACTGNLFMTVHAAVFVPIAVGACVRQMRRPSFEADIVLAAAVAASWLAHPPVALWLTIACGFARLVVLSQTSVPRWRQWGSLLGAAFLGFALAAFVFASVAELNAKLGYFPEEEFSSLGGLNTIMDNIWAAFPDSLLPVSPKADALSDIQLGYVYWGLLVGTIITAIRAKPSSASTPWQTLIITLTGTALLFLILTLPVPYLTRALWSIIPRTVQTITAIWPMQRLYLIASALIIFGAALALPTWLARSNYSRRTLVVLLSAATLWGAWQGRLFINRGVGLRWTALDTQRSHLKPNLDLTVTSYAFLGLPTTFVHGVMDPLYEFQLLKSDLSEADSPYKAALTTGQTVAQGTAVLEANLSGNPIVKVTAPRLVLEPGKRYFLSFDFLTPPFTGDLDIIGTTLVRHYALPAAGGPAGFGMSKNHRHAFSLWTNLSTPEEIEVRLTSTAWNSNLAHGTKLANFSLLVVDPAKLPVQLDSLAPFRCSVDATTSGGFLVTPRRYMPGYMARVFDRDEPPLRSPDGQVMIPIPKGHSMVELRYVGSKWVHCAFWVSAASWLGLVLWCGGQLVGLDPSRWLISAALWVRPALVGWWKLKLTLLLLAICIAALLTTIRHRQIYRQSVGPAEMTVLLPLRKTGTKEPLLVTGRNSAGTTIFADYVDDEHIRIGADIWGTLLSSPVISTDYFRVHRLTVNASGLYPLDHPAVQQLNPRYRERLREKFTIQWDGNPVVSATRDAYESTVEEVTFGKSKIGNSLTQPEFHGEIRLTKRFVVPQEVALASGQGSRLKVRFSNHLQRTTEVLFSIGAHGESGAITATNESATRLIFSYRSADGTVKASASHDYEPGQDHILDAAFGADSTESNHPAVSVSLSFDGNPLFGPETLQPTKRPILLRSGFSQASILPTESNFSGRELALASLDLTLQSPRQENLGPLRLVISLPKDKMGRAQPLLSTGKTGAGDFAYVVYTDEKHIRFGLDHWGIGGAQSEPVEIDYDAPQEIEIRLGSLYPAEQDPSWSSVPVDARRRHKSEMEIRLNGQSMLKAPLSAHPSTFQEMTIGRNAIGGSGCDTEFTGIIYSSTFLGLAPER